MVPREQIKYERTTLTSTGSVTGTLISTKQDRVVGHFWVYYPGLLLPVVTKGTGMNDKVLCFIFSLTTIQRADMIKAAQQVY